MVNYLEQTSQLHHLRKKFGEGLNDFCFAWLEIATDNFYSHNSNKRFGLYNLKKFMLVVKLRQVHFVNEKHFFDLLVKICDELFSFCN